ncbi:MAG: hypothetical protein QMD96_06250 [Anaerosomatales bacterium]|nr:hypothetical protein [Anaerosomatales bacterium]
MSRFIVTTVGTSLLTNQAKKVGQELVSQLYRHANDREPHSPEWRQTVAGLLDQALEKPDSAEISTIKAYEAAYGTLQPDDYHMLIASDTFQGKEVAERLRQIFQRRGQTVDVVAVRGLTTESETAFQNAMKEFLATLQNQLDSFVARQGKQAEVIFTVSGGFKSMVAMMTAFGLLKGAPVFLMFETGGLLRIPAMPIVFDESKVSDDALALLEMMDRELMPDAERMRDAGVPDILYVVDEAGTATLSAWGLAVLQTLSRRIYPERLLAWPRIEYEQMFLRDWEKQREPDDRRRLQETLARMAAILEEHRDPARLKTDPALQGEMLRNTGIEHARVTQSLRISYTVEGGDEPRLKMRRFGAHDDVNGNP